MRIVTSTPPANTDMRWGRCAPKVNKKRPIGDQRIATCPTGDGYRSSQSTFAITHKANPFSAAFSPAAEVCLATLLSPVGFVLIPWSTTGLLLFTFETQRPVHEIRVCGSCPVEAVNLRWASGVFSGHAAGGTAWWG